MAGTGKMKIAMTEDEVREFIESEKILNIATIGPDGYPHVVAMWYVVVDGRIRFWTVAKSQKAVNLRRDARFTGMIEAGDTFMELRGVELFGRAVIIDDPAVKFEVGKAVSLKYNGPFAETEQGTKAVEAQVPKRIAVEFDVERIVSWDHRKMLG